MSLRYSRANLKACVAQICESVGWHTINSTPLEILTDILERYLVSISRTSQLYCEQFERSQGNLDDLSLAFTHMGIMLSELDDYYTHVDGLPLPHDVLQFPIVKTTDMCFPNPKSREILEEREEHVADYFPYFYPPPETEEPDPERKSPDTQMTNVECVDSPMTPVAPIIADKSTPSNLDSSHKWPRVINNVDLPEDAGHSQHKSTITLNSAGEIVCLYDGCQPMAFAAPIALRQTLNTQSDVREKREDEDSSMNELHIEDEFTLEKHDVKKKKLSKEAIQNLGKKFTSKSKLKMAKLLAKTGGQFSKKKFWSKNAKIKMKDFVLSGEKNDEKDYENEYDKARLEREALYGETIDAVIRSTDSDFSETAKSDSKRSKSNKIQKRKMQTTQESVKADRTTPVELRVFDFSADDSADDFSTPTMKLSKNTALETMKLSKNMGLDTMRLSKNTSLDTNKTAKAVSEAPPIKPMQTEPVVKSMKSSRADKNFLFNEDALFSGDIPTIVTNIAKQPNKANIQEHTKVTSDGKHNTNFTDSKNIKVEIKQEIVSEPLKIRSTFQEKKDKEEKKERSLDRFRVDEGMKSEYKEEKKDQHKERRHEKKDRHRDKDRKSLKHSRDYEKTSSDSPVPTVPKLKLKLAGRELTVDKQRSLSPSTEDIKVDHPRIVIKPIKQEINTSARQPDAHESRKDRGKISQSPHDSDESETQSEKKHSTTSRDKSDVSVRRKRSPSSSSRQHSPVNPRPTIDISQPIPKPQTKNSKKFDVKIEANGAIKLEPSSKHDKPIGDGSGTSDDQMPLSPTKRKPGRPPKKRMNLSINLDLEENDESFGKDDDILLSPVTVDIPRLSPRRISVKQELPPLPPSSRPQQVQRAVFVETVATFKEETDESGEKVWICPGCKMADDGSPMIGCDICDDWYHWPCVRITKEPSDDQWYCPKCVGCPMPEPIAKKGRGKSKGQGKKKKRH